ncbi:MAG TPA: hypothetical protein VGJ82_07920 [Thermoanaerobaculia bacterium]
MAEDLFETLLRFHREVTVPEMERFHREVTVPGMERFHREVTVPDMMRFHREVAIPDMQHLVREPLEEKIESVRTELRSEMLGGFDATYKRVGIMETEMTLMRGALRDLERQVATISDRVAAIQGSLKGVDEKLDHFALRSEVAELKEQLHSIQQRVDEIETLLNEN